tara:strand:+ start:184 stop:870 length:687 start_codon:yes stop_codon:yes gene_type:complete
VNNIIIADKSELILKGLQKIFQDNLDTSIYLANDFISLKEYLAHLENPILIIDYTAEGFSLEKIVMIKHEYPKLKIVGITPYTNAQTIVQAFKAGVESHVKKECSVREIRNAYNATLKGTKFFCGDIVNQMRHEQIDVNKIAFQSLDPNPVKLSERELQIIQFIAEGYTNSQIAAIIYLSNHTVNTHRKNIMKKLGVNNTAGIVMYAVKTQMVRPNQFSFKQPSENNG